MSLPEAAAALLDLEHLKRFSQNPKGLRELIDAFLDTTEPILNELERVSRQQNAMEFHQILHALNGAANSAGARAMADQCKVLAQQREPERRVAILHDLADCFQRTREMLKAILVPLSTETRDAGPLDVARKTLLLVEDNASARALLHAILADEYELIDAETGETALRFCEGAVVPDAAIVDLNLRRSRCSGLDVLQQLDSRIPAIVLTVDRSRDSMRAAIRAGAWAYLNKPPDPDLLVTAVEAVIARARGITDPSAPGTFDLATGLVMAAHSLDPIEAQQLITAEAMAQRRKPADLAEEIVAIQRLHNRMARAARCRVELSNEPPS